MPDRRGPRSRAHRGDHRRSAGQGSRDRREAQPRVRRGKKTNGRKRHIAVDTIGLLLTELITAAGVQDRDGAKPLPRNLRRAIPPVRLTWADGGYAGKLVTWATSKLKPKLTLESSSGPMTCAPSGCCAAAGSPGGPWHGSPGAAAPSATANACQHTTKPWSTGR